MSKRMKLFEFELEQRRTFAGITGLYGLASYAYAYWRTAHALVEHLGPVQHPSIRCPLHRLFEGGGRPDFSTFPIAYLYRHALELMLKAILVEHHPKYSSTPADIFERRHKFTDTYIDELKATIANVNAGEQMIDVTPDEWSHLEDIFRQWRDRDLDGMAFRYSVNLKNTKSLIDPDFTFNVQRFSTAMEEVLEVLAGIKHELDSLKYSDFLRGEVPDE